MTHPAYPPLPDSGILFLLTMGAFRVVLPQVTVVGQNGVKSVFGPDVVAFPEVEEKYTRFRAMGDHEAQVEHYWHDDDGVYQALIEEFSGRPPVQTQPEPFLVETRRQTAPALPYDRSLTRAAIVAEAHPGDRPEGHMPRVLARLATAEPRVWVEVAGSPDAPAWLLSVLATRCPWGPVLWALATNPQTPIWTLRDLSYVLPGVVATNPALPLQALTDPSGAWAKDFQAQVRMAFSGGPLAWQEP